jgi:hypothetical protein
MYVTMINIWLVLWIFVALHHQRSRVAIWHIVRCLRYGIIYCIDIHYYAGIVITSYCIVKTWPSIGACCSEWVLVPTNTDNQSYEYDAYERVSDGRAQQQQRPTNKDSARVDWRHQCSAAAGTIRFSCTRSSKCIRQSLLSIRARVHVSSWLS